MKISTWNRVQCTNILFYPRTLLFPCSRKRREQAGEVWCSFHSLTFLTFAVSKLCKTGCHPEKGFCTVSWENKSQRYFQDYCKNYIFKRFFRIIPGPWKTFCPGKFYWNAWLFPFLDFLDIFQNHTKLCGTGCFLEKLFALENSTENAWLFLFSRFLQK